MKTNRVKLIINGVLPTAEKQCVRLLHTRIVFNIL